MLAPTTYDTLVVTAPGLEQITQNELAALGVQQSADIEPGAIPIRAPLQTLYTLNLNLRSASRITVLASSFRARTFAELERRAKAVSWEEWLPDAARVRLRVTCRKSRLYHSDAVAERVAGAIVARTKVNVHFGEDESDAGESQLILVRLVRDECSIRIDTSGAHLHRRGYRQAVGKAPLRETLAAAMLFGAQWNPAAPLIDPFCGSGTIAIEAALLALKVAPGKQRNFAFMGWPNFNRRTWSGVLDRTRSQERTTLPSTILASDRDAGAIDAARANAERAGVVNHLDIRCQPISALAPPASRGWLVTNPPYGVRVGERDRLRDLYATLGRVARDRLSGWHIALLSAHPALDAQLALPLEECFRTSNGGLNVRLVARVPLEHAGSSRDTSLVAR